MMVLAAGFIAAAALVVGALLGPKRTSDDLLEAYESGIPATKRDVFLDHARRAETVLRELERLKKLARERGAAVAIGHPYPETLEVLEKALPALAEEGIELVPLSQLTT